MRNEVETPALLLDLDPARRNIARMAALIAELGAGLRPHVKAHKSPELARLQIAAGPVGVACATVWEAVVMARSAGIADIPVANEVVGDAKLRALAAVAREHRSRSRWTIRRTPGSSRAPLSRPAPPSRC